MSFPPRLAAAETHLRHPLLRALLHTTPGLAVVGGAATKAFATVAQRLSGRAAWWLEAIDTVGTIALLGGLIWFLVRLLSGARRRLLWRVRRKLILSYIFVGFVPALLIIIFCLLCGLLLFGTISQYIVDSRMTSTMEASTFFARTAALEIAQLDDEKAVAAYLARKQAALAPRQPGVSLAVVPAARECADAEPPAGGASLRRPGPIAAGPWPHVEPPTDVPGWVPCDGFSGLVAYRVAGRDGSGADNYLALRSVVLAEGPTPRFAVILDLPLTDDTVRQLQEETGIELRAVTVSGVAPQPARDGAVPLRRLAPADGGPFQLAWVAFFDFTDWQTGRVGSATISIGMRIGEIYDRLSPATLGGGTFGRALVMVIAVVGVLFLLIQFIALVMGLALARSITGSVHELFVGTVRVQEGDFAHRIQIRTRDQLGELADSFNVMTSRLTDLLAQMAEKKRLEEELRIAREIQMSLLPQGPAHMPGLTMTAHCAPAREVGGDYYDFLPIDADRIGILIADVSGKGTSAALYMAELKGLMLSLSQIHSSPRALMIAANRIIADNLDNRSFITMTYVIADVKQRTMTYARAGHTPLIHLPARPAVRRARILVPDGMVLGLKLDDGTRFNQALEEVTLPLEAGDLFVLFTDGISEAMNAAEDLFGESRLGRLIEEHADLPFDELRERILREVRAFTGEPGPHDDMTLILIKVEPKTGEATPLEVQAVRTPQPVAPAG